MVFILAFFGIFIDMVHVAMPIGKLVFSIIEDGGEMIIMSVIVWRVLSLAPFLQKHFNFRMLFGC